MKAKNHASRDTRLPYRGKVRLLVPFAPWRLLLTLSGLNVSNTGVLALLPVDTKDATSVHALLMAGDPYELQLEHDTEHVMAPFLRARLARSQRTTIGWELAFSFEGTDAGLLGLIHELSGRTALHA